MILKTFFIFYFFLFSAFSGAVVSGACSSSFTAEDVRNSKTVEEFKEEIKREVDDLTHDFEVLKRILLLSFTSEQMNMSLSNIESKISSLQRKAYSILDEIMKKIEENFVASHPPLEEANSFITIKEKRVYSLKWKAERIKYSIEKFRKLVQDLSRGMVIRRRLLELNQVELIITYMEQSISYIEKQLERPPEQLIDRVFLVGIFEPDLLTTNFTFFEYNPLPATASRKEIQKEIERLKGEIDDIRTAMMFIDSLVFYYPDRNNPFSTDWSTYDKRSQAVRNKGYFVDLPALARKLTITQMENNISSLEKRLGQLPPDEKPKRRRGRPRKSADVHY